MILTTPQKNLVKIESREEIIHEEGKSIDR